MTASDATAVNRGRLEAVAASIGGRTVLRRLHSEGTLKAMRAHHLDPALPAMAFLTVASPGGGVLQGDRLEMDISVEEGALLHVGTTSATRVYAMPGGQAEARTGIEVSRGAYAEFVPDPFIPYGRSRYVARARHVVAEGGSLVLAEVVGPGRLARGETLAYELFQTETEVRRPNGRLVFRDTTRLCPSEDVTSPGVLGRWRALGSLYAVAEYLDDSVFDQALASCETAHLGAGHSALPNSAGAWFRVMAPDAPSAQDAVRAAWTAVRQRLLGSPPPPSRRY